MVKLTDRNITIIFGAITMISILFAIFALNKNRTILSNSKVVYEDSVRTLDDSLRVLLKRSDSIFKHIQILENRSVSTKTKIIKVEKDEDEINCILDNGGLDENIRFLSDYLSEKSSNR